MGGMEKFKHLAMYLDESNEDTGINAFAIKREHVQSVLEVLEPALDHLRDPRLLRSSALVWEQAGRTLEAMKAAGQRYFENVSPSVPASRTRGAANSLIRILRPA